MQIKRELFEAEVQASSVFNAQILAYMQRQMVQLQEGALAYSRYTIEKRLARWLLVAADLTGSDELPLTHESLSIMLGIRRAGVTVSLNKLMELGGVSLKRGVIVISDRLSLQQVAGAGYRRTVAARTKSDADRALSNATVSRLIFDRDW